MTGSTSRVILSQVVGRINDWQNSDALESISKRAPFIASARGEAMAPAPSARSQTDLRLDVITEFLEACVHHTLQARGVYPKELFESANFYGARVQRARHPDLDRYICDAIYALRGAISTGDIQRVVLVIKSGDSGQDGVPLERHVFDFALRSDYLEKTPSKRDVDQLASAFAACVSKISFLDSTLPPLPSEPQSQGGITFEIVAYANKKGVVEQLGRDAWSEERVVDSNPENNTRDENGNDRSMGTERPMEFAVGPDSKHTYPVKTTKTALIDIDVFVERKKSNSSKTCVR